MEDVKIELKDQKPGEIIFMIGRTVHGINQAILDKNIYKELKEYVKTLLKSVYNTGKINTKELENYCKLLKITVPKSRLCNFLLADQGSLDANLFQEICTTLERNRWNFIVHRQNNRTF